VMMLIIEDCCLCAGIDGCEEPQQS
jgi:hypothetical protein